MLFPTILVFVIGTLSLVFLKLWLSKRQFGKTAVATKLQSIAQEMALENWAEALALLQPLLARHLGGATSLLYLAQIQKATACSTEQILKTLDSALEKEPENLSIYHLKGLLLLEGADFENAYAALSKAKGVLKTDADLLALGTASFQKGLVDEAWGAIQYRLRSCSDGRLFALAADCQFYWGSWEQAAKLYKRAQVLGWQNYRILSRLGHCFRRQGHLDEAASTFKRVLEYDSSDIGCTLGLGACLEAKGQFAEALRLYQSGRAWESSDPKVLRQAGICALQLGEHNYASLYLKEALERGCNHVDTYQNYGLALEANQQYTEAEKTYLAMRKMHPESASSYLNLSYLYAMGFCQELTSHEALQMAHKALELKPDPRTWELVSACQARAGNFQEAHQIQERLSNLDTDRPSRLRRLLAMRNLRKGECLTEEHIARHQVA